MVATIAIIHEDKKSELVFYNLFVVSCHHNRRGSELDVKNKDIISIHFSHLISTNGVPASQAKLFTTKEVRASDLPSKFGLYLEVIL